MQLPGVERHAAVARQDDDRLSRVRELRRDAERDRGAERAHRAQAHPVAGQPRRQGEPAPLGEVAAVDDPGDVAAGGLAHLAHDAERVQGRDLGGLVRRARGEERAARAPELLDPRLLAPAAVALGRRRELLERDAGVRLDRELRGAVVPELGAVDVDLDQRGVRAEETAVREAEVDPLGDEQHDVGAPDLARGRVEDRVGVAEAERVLVRHRAARHADREARQLGDLDEALERLPPAAPPHAAAGEHHGPLGPVEQPDRGVERRLARRGGLDAEGLGQPDVVVHACLGDVARDRQVHRARSAADRLAVGGREVFAEPPRVLGDARPLRDRAHHVELVDLLQRTPLAQARLVHAADREHRARGHPRRGEAGQRVRVPRPARDDGHARPSRHPRPAVGEVGGARLVARVDDGEALVEAGVEDRVHVVAAETEDALDAVPAHRAHEQVSAADLAHVGPPRRLGTIVARARPARSRRPAPDARGFRNGPRAISSPPRRSRRARRSSAEGGASARGSSRGGRSRRRGATGSRSR